MLLTNMIQLSFLYFYNQDTHSNVTLFKKKKQYFEDDILILDTRCEWCI